LAGEFERGLRQIDAVIMPRPGARQRRLHLAGIAASDIDKGERLGKRCKRAVQDRPNFFMRERVLIHQFLVGRPLLLELFERGMVGDGALGMEMVNMDVHSRVASSVGQAAFYCRLGCTKVSAAFSATNRQPSGHLESTFEGNPRG